MSRGLVFDDIIMNMIRNKALECHEEEVGVFLQIFITKTYLYRGPLQYFYWKKGTRECLDVPRVHFNFEIIQMKQYLTNILKSDTSSDYMK